jgi:hypothetical protein
MSTHFATVSLLTPPTRRRMPAIQKRYTPGWTQFSSLISDATSKMDARTASMRASVAALGVDTSAMRSGTGCELVNWCSTYEAKLARRTAVQEDGRRLERNEKADSACRSDVRLTVEQHIYIPCPWMQWTRRHCSHVVRAQKRQRAGGG